MEPNPTPLNPTVSPVNQPQSPGSQSSDPLWTQLENAVALAAKQDQIVWAIFGVFWAANAALLVALFVTGDYPKPHVGFIVSTVGFAFSVVWIMVQFRAIAYFAYYEHVVNLLENHLQVPTLYKLVGIRAKVGGISVRPIMRCCAIASAILWVYSVLRFFPNLCSGSQN